MQAVPAPETMTITFRGKPVRGTHGIFADFATSAMGKLSNVYAAFVANAKGITLGCGGAITEVNKHKLLITGTALGSFGFELELPAPEPTPAQVQLPLMPQENPLVKARDMLQRVITQSLEGDDDQLAESFEDIDQRTLTELRDFYEVLRQNEAVFALKIGAREVRCHSVEALAQASARLKSDNITTDMPTFTGKLVGILPQKRDFEFETAPNEIIRGKIDKSIEDASILNQDWLNKCVTIRLASRRVGQGKPRYTLTSLEYITLTDEEASHG